MASSSTQKEGHSQGQQESTLEPSLQEVISCAAPMWYKQFQSYTFKSVFIPLSEEFVSYLLSDGCVLPQGCLLPTLDAKDTDSSSDEEEQWSDEDTDHQTNQMPAFPELVRRISEGIEELGGAVLPKLNWSAPRDAVWVVPSNSLRCTCAAEVILLLKSSNFVTHDISRVLEHCRPSVTKITLQYYLCLRKWESIHPSSEFRCFVRSHQLIGISQRNHTICYQHLLDTRDSLKAEIIQFYSEIKGKFPNSTYVFDICRIKEKKYWLIDFNSCATITDPLLFSWTELLSDGTVLQEQLPILRLVDGASIQPSTLQTHRLPQDIIDLTSGEDIHKFAQLFIKGGLPGQDSEASD